MVHLVPPGTQARVHAEMLRMKYTYIFSSSTLATYLEARASAEKCPTPMSSLDRADCIPSVYSAR